MTGTASARANSAEGDGTQGDPPRSRSKSTLLFLRDILVIFVVAIVLSVGIKEFLVRSFYIPSGSMESTLNLQDRILVNQLVPGLVDLQHGDVIVFEDPGGWLGQSVPIEQNPVAGAIDWFFNLVGLSASDSNDHLIKRVIGLPGDTVACCNELGQMTVNGVPLDEPYLKEGTPRASREDFSVTVPDGALWVMGDNRDNSCDSRCNQDKPYDGFVPIDNVVGRAFVITWPVGNWGWLDNYPATFAEVERANG